MRIAIYAIVWSAIAIFAPMASASADDYVTDHERAVFLDTNTLPDPPTYWVTGHERSFSLDNQSLS